MSKQLQTRSMNLKLSVIVLMLAIYSITPCPVIAELRITDALGREVEISGSVNNVVALSPSITEILASLELLDKVKGCDSQSLNNVWYMNASNLLREMNVRDLGGYWWSTLKTQDILEINSDLVLADKGAHRPLLQFFEEYNVRVVYLNGGSATSINEVYHDIYLVGSIFNKTDKALEVINEIERSFSHYYNLIEKYRGIRVLIIIGIWQGIWVTGKGTFIDDALTRLGLENIAKVFGWAAVNVESITSWNPDLIIVSGMGITERDLEEQGITALNKPIVFLNTTETDIFSRPGPLLKYLPEIMYNIITVKSSPRNETSQMPPVITTTVTSEKYTVTTVFTETVREFLTITKATTTTIPVTITTIMTFMIPEPRTDLRVIIAMALVGLIIGVSVGYYAGYKRHR